MSKIVSNRTPNNRRGARLGALLLTVGILVAGCSTKAEDLSDEELRNELIEVLTSDDALTDGQAVCVVDGLFDNADRDQLNRMANTQADEELTEEDNTLLVSVVIDCL